MHARMCGQKSTPVIGAWFSNAAKCQLAARGEVSGWLFKEALRLLWRRLLTRRGPKTTLCL